MYAAAKYDVKFKLINAADYGVPQMRERVVIIGTRSDLNAEWSFPEMTHSEDRLLWEMFISKEYWDRHKIKMSGRPFFNENINEKLVRLKENFGLFEPALLPWKTIRDALQNVPDPRTKHCIPDHIFKDGARSY